jgi:hypothetical protein
MIGRYKPAQRSSPIRAMTLAAYKAQEARKAERAERRARNRRFIAKMSGKTLVPSFKMVCAQLDAIWSIVIRRRDMKLYAGYCLVCAVKHQLGLARYEKQPIEVAYHIEPRGNLLVRWRLDNGVGACARCNDGEKWSRSGGRRSLQDMYRKIHVALVGETKLQELELLARQKADFSTAELIEMRDELKAVAEGRA